MSLPDKIPIRWMPDLYTAHEPVSCGSAGARTYVVPSSEPERAGPPTRGTPGVRRVWSPDQGSGREEGVLRPVPDHRLRLFLSKLD